MRRTISTTTQTPAIVIVQGAYEQFCAPSERATTYASPKTFDFVLSVEASSIATPQDLWLQFQSLAAAWRQQRGIMSSVTETAMCPAYQSIIGMGEAAIPFIIATLEIEGDDPDQWFCRCARSQV